MAFTPRRVVLSEIAASPLSARAVDSEANVAMVPESFLTPSPEEQIIRQRSTRHFGTPISLDFDDCENAETPPKGLFNGTLLGRKRLVMSPPCATSSPVKDALKVPGPRTKRSRMQRKSRSIPLATELQGFTPEQLAGLIDRLVCHHPELEQEVRDSLPIPDIKPLGERLKYLHHNIFKSLPSTRWGSSRDAFTFHRVRAHLDAFKKACVDQGRVLVNAQCWEAVVRYTIIGWRYVHLVPTWDDPSHNNIKTSCFRHLAAQCMMALKKSVFEKEILREIRKKLMTAAQLNNEIQPCINYISKVLDRLP